MADIPITIVVPNDKVAVVQEGFFRVFPVPIQTDVNGDAIPVDAAQKIAWVQEKVRQFIVDTVHRGLSALATQTAMDETVSDDGVAITIS